MFSFFWFILGYLLQIENLFYNMAARRKTLQNSADDYPKIVDMLSRFAIHHINVGFSCRKVWYSAIYAYVYSLFFFQRTIFNHIESAQEQDRK